MPVDFDLDARQRGPTPRSDVLEDEAMHARRTEPDVQNTSRSRAVGAFEARRSFADDLRPRVRVREPPDVAGRGAVLNVDREQVVGSCFEERLAVGLSAHTSAPEFEIDPAGPVGASARFSSLTDVAWSWAAS